MCGFAGVIRLSDKYIANLESLAIAMGETLEHRGPDDSTSFAEDNIAVAFKRLSIIDVAGGRQPQFNEDRSVVCFLNGEIVNYIELRQVLVKAGHQLGSDHS